MSPLGVIVAIVMVDLLGFSVVMPLLAPFAKQYDLGGWQIGLLFAAYPMCQLAGPVLGRMSDRYGRRPLLIVSQAGTALSFLILGLAHDFPTMLLARMLDGASGGNILVAQAYVADVTAPEHRSRNGADRHGLRSRVRARPGAGRSPRLAASARGVAASFAVPRRGPFLDRRLRARVDPPARVMTGRPRCAAVVASADLARAGRDRHSPHSRPARRRGRLVVFAFATLEGTFSLFLRDRASAGKRAGRPSGSRTSG